MDNSKKIKRLTSKIEYFEDMLLRSKNTMEQEKIQVELRIMRIELQKMKFNQYRES